MDREDLSYVYRTNPHFKMDAKTAEQLGIDTQDVAYEVEEPALPINQQVIVRKKRGRGKKTASDNTADDSTV